MNGMSYLNPNHVPYPCQQQHQLYQQNHNQQYHASFHAQPNNPSLRFASTNSANMGNMHNTAFYASRQIQNHSYTKMDNKTHHTIQGSLFGDGNINSHYQNRCVNGVSSYLSAAASTTPNQQSKFSSGSDTKSSFNSPRATMALPPQNFSSLSISPSLVQSSTKNTSMSAQTQSITLPSTPPPQNLRNDPHRLAKIKTELCLYYTQGWKCPFGSKCNYAHGIDELKYTKLIDMERAGLVDDVKTYRTHPCFSWVSSGCCPFGQRCSFAVEISKDEYDATRTPWNRRCQYNPREVVVVREIAFGPKGDSNANVALWFDISSSDVATCTHQQVKRHKRSRQRSMQQNKCVPSAGGRVGNCNVVQGSFGRFCQLIGSTMSSASGVPPLPFGDGRCSGVNTKTLFCNRRHWRT